MVLDLGQVFGRSELALVLLRRQDLFQVFFLYVLSDTEVIPTVK